MNAAFAGAHLVGSVGLLAGNWKRVSTQPGAARNTAVKSGLTVVALGATVWTRLLGKKIEQAEIHRARGATSASTSPISSSSGPQSQAAEADKQIGQQVGQVADQLPVGVEDAERQLRTLQFVIPAVTGVALALGSQHGEQQRPSQQLRELARQTLGSVAS